MEERNKYNLFKILFVWSAIIFGVVGAWLDYNWLIILSIFMLALAAIYIRYYTMKERLQKNKKTPADK